MIAFLEDEFSEFEYYKTGFDAAGESLTRFIGAEFLDILDHKAFGNDFAIEAVIINTVRARDKLTSKTAELLDVPVIVLTDTHILDQTRTLFQKGADDVITKPIHHEELILRLASIKRRLLGRSRVNQKNKIHVHFDGRDPEFNEQSISLPRRERRILEYLLMTNGRRVTKTQIFEAVYGIENENYDVSVVESHICRLRKKLKNLIGYDPIDSARHLGYKINQKSDETDRTTPFLDAA